MKAMILAAGMGTRLRPLTDSRPKALVEVGNCTLLELAIARLRSSGVDEVIINVHHFADMIIHYVESKNNFGMRVEISREEVLLDTGGGLKRAAHFFCENSTRDEPFIVHNVDVVSTIDLGRMVRCHVESHALATLAVQQRTTSRYLLFDEQLELCGRRTGCDGKAELARPSRQVQALAFSGIHVISPRLFHVLNEDGVFPIIPAYLRLAGQGEKIRAFRADEFYWRDLGKPEDLAQAADELKQQGIYSILN